jgi:autotransporter-associated beta strand protein
MRPKFFSPIALFTGCSMFLTVSSASAQDEFDWTPGTTVPDNNPVGAADTRNIIFDPAAVITGLEVRLNLTGTWNGDIYASLVHDSGFTVLLNRPGNTLSNPGGSGSSGMNITFSDSAATDIHTGIPNSGFVTGTWQPDARTADPLLVTNSSPRTAFLSSFNEAPVQGNWTLFLADNAAADTSVLAGWGLTITSEIRDFAIWDANGNTTGIGGAGTWNSTSSTWATSNVGTSAAAQDADAQLVFRGTGGAVAISGTVSPEAGFEFQSNGYTLSGGTIDLAGASASANDLKVSTGISATIGSTLAGSNGLTKSGTGELVLTGTNTYSGITAITDGTLKLNGTGSIASSTEIQVGGALDVSDLTASTFDIGATQTLSGGGTINATDKTVSILGTHAIGQTEQLEVTGNLDYASGSIFEWSLAAGPTDPGADLSNEGAYGKVDVTGDLDGSGEIFSIVLGSGDSFSDAFWDTNKSWTDIFTADNSFDLASIFKSFSGTGLTSGGLVEGRGTFTLSSGSLNWSAIPEPSSALVGLLLAAGLLRRRRPGPHRSAYPAQ